MQTYWVLSVDSVWKMASKWKVLSLKEKIELINFTENGKGCHEISKEFDVGKTQASLILKWKAEILEEFENNGDLERKRKRHKSLNDDINEWNALSTGDEKLLSVLPDMKDYLEQKNCCIVF